MRKWTMCKLVVLYLLSASCFEPASTLLLKSTQRSHDDNDVLSEDCIGKQSGIYPHPINCSMYITCDGRGNRVMVHECQPNHFHPEYKVCVWKEIYKCAQSSPENTTWVVSYCDGKVGGVYPDPGKCDSYVLCTHEGAYHMKCPKGFQFRLTTGKCEKTSKVRCIEIRRMTGQSPAPSRYDQA